jgi:tetratricopeptide (TPR) repeat protein
MLKRCYFAQLPLLSVVACVLQLKLQGAPAGQTAAGQQDARSAYEGGCLLAWLDRFKEAIPLLETAVAELPSAEGCWGNTQTIQDTLKVVRREHQRSQDSLAKACDAKVSGTDRETKAKKGTKDLYIKPCEASEMANGLKAGEYQRALAALTAQLQRDEGLLKGVDSSEPSAHNLRGSTAGIYTIRALSLYALGNSLAALRDLQSSMDLYRDYPSTSEFENYFYRAAIHSETGNVQGAADDCRTVLTFRNLQSFARSYCTKLVAAQPSAASTSSDTRTNGGNLTGAATGGASLRSEIDELEKSHRYLPLPPPQSARGASGGFGDATRTIKNSTPYQVRVVFAGSVEREITLDPGTAQTLHLPPGQYRVLERASAPDVLPFLGSQTYNPGDTYTSQIIIQSR